MSDLATPAAVRRACREGRWDRPTAGLAPGQAQANLVIVPTEDAFDFLRFCQRNPKPTPLLEVLDPGDPEPKLVAPGADLRTDLPRYLAHAVLRQVLYLYVLCYPMSLFPVDRVRKWGFSGPMGIYFDRCNVAILERAIGIENASALRNQIKDAPEVQSLLEWVQNHDDLDEDDIERSWEQCSKDIPSKDSARTLQHRLALWKAHHRTLGWALNYVGIESRIDEIMAKMSDDWLENTQRRIFDW